MGALKDIVDLCRDLHDEAGNGKIAVAVAKIQSLTLALQSEQASLIEKNAELVKENLDLKRQMHEMECSHATATAELQSAHQTEIIKITETHTRLRGELDPKTVEILKVLFKDAIPMSDTQIAHRFQIDLSTTLYHIECLQKREFIVITRLGPIEYSIATKGREYIVSNHLNE